MYKDVFQNKKALIFDLETVVAGLEEVYAHSIYSVLVDLEINWINQNNHIQNGNTIEEAWKSIFRDPLLKQKIPLEKVISSTYKKMSEDLDSLDSLEVRDGFWLFIDEVKEILKPKFILKSEFNNEITNKIIKLSGIEKFSEVEDEE